MQCRTYLLSCGRYVERNPVEAGLVAHAWEYPWSSAAAYALGRADPLLADHAEYRAWADSPGRRQERWREFLEGADPHEDAIRRGEWVLGDEAFRRQVLQAHGRPGPRRRGRPPKAASGPISS